MLRYDNPVRGRRNAAETRRYRPDADGRPHRRDDQRDVVFDPVIARTDLPLRSRPRWAADALEADRRWRAERGRDVPWPCPTFAPSRTPVWVGEPCAPRPTPALDVVGQLVGHVMRSTRSLRAWR